MFAMAEHFAKAKRELHHCEAKDYKIEVSSSTRLRPTFAAGKEFVTMK